MKILFHFLPVLREFDETFPTDTKPSECPGKKGKEGVIRIRSKSLRGARLAIIILGRPTSVWLGRARKKARLTSQA